jgi:vacuolar-type H+-ATPase subunit B/Vma2
LTTGEVIFHPFLEALTPMLNSPTWQRRHAILSAIAAVAEGCPDAVLDHLSELKNVAVRCARDDHPRVRYAAVYAIGQLCTDMDGAVQEEYGEEILRTLIEVARGREPRYVSRARREQSWADGLLWTGCRHSRVRFASRLKD